MKCSNLEHFLANIIKLFSIYLLRKAAKHIQREEGAQTGGLWPKNPGPLGLLQSANAPLKRPEML